MTNTANYSLLKVKEQLSENLSSLQIVKTLDELLFNAVKPLMRNTDFMDYTLVELLPYLFLNRRRRFSNVPHGELCDNIFSVIMIQNREDKIALLQKQGLERSVYFAALVKFETEALKYFEAVNQQLANMHNSLPYVVDVGQKLRKNFFIHGNEYQTARSVAFWLKHSYRFKQMIVEKYIRRAFTEARKMASQTNLQIDVDDLFRNLILSVHKAIDKYDIKKGPLASYVAYWFLEAKKSYRNAHEYGVAYNMPTGKRKKLLEEGAVQSLTTELNDSIAESISDDSQDTLANMIDTENQTMNNNLACRADKNKIYCLLNNIQYQPTEADIALQRQSFVEV